MSIVLVGMPAAGKSTVGGLLAERLRLPFVDLDKRIEAEHSRTVADIFTECGEVEFRRLEAMATKEVLAGSPVVLSLGGGAVTNPDVRETISPHTVVWLQVSLGAAVLRVGKTSHRPLLAGSPEEQLRALMTARSALYAKVADIEVDTTRRRPSKVVAAIEAALADIVLRAGARSDVSVSEEHHG